MPQHKYAYSAGWWLQLFCSVIFLTASIGAIIVAAQFGTGNEIGLTNESDFNFTATTWLVVWGSVVTAAVLLWCVGFWYIFARRSETPSQPLLAEEGEEAGGENGNGGGGGYNGSDGPFMYCLWLLWGLLALFVVFPWLFIGTIFFVRGWDNVNDLEYGWSIAALVLSYLVAAFFAFQTSYGMRKHAIAIGVALKAALRSETATKAAVMAAMPSGSIWHE